MEGEQMRDWARRRRSALLGAIGAALLISFGVAWVAVGATGHRSEPSAATTHRQGATASECPKGELRLPPGALAPATKAALAQAANAYPQDTSGARAQTASRAGADHERGPQVKHE